MREGSAIRVQTCVSDTENLLDIPYAVSQNTPDLPRRPPRTPAR